MSANDRSDRFLFVLGTTLLVAYVAQAMLGLSWSTLAHLQTERAYKLGSGVALGTVLFYQWSVGTRRLVAPVGAVVRHKLVGALAPAALYLHACRFGYGYLALLVWAYLGTLAIGLCHRPIVRLHARALFSLWFVLHVATSLAVLVLGGYHVVIALAYV